MKKLLDDGDERLNGHRNSDLGLGGVLVGAIGGLDAKVLLGPLDELLDLPAILFL